MCDISKEISENLMKNAIDFFEKSIEDFDKQEYKYSIIHFSSALEAIFKSRLAYEHWSLIVNDQPPNIQKMEDGSVHTIGAKDCLRVMKSALRENIKKEQNDAFETIFNERNKAVHYHLNLSDEKRLYLASSQFAAYYQIFKMLSEGGETWNKILTPYKSRLNSIYTQLQEHLGFKYEARKDRYKNHKKQKCDRCDYISKVIREEKCEIEDFDLIKLYETHCFTCGRSSSKRIDKAYLKDTLESTLKNEKSPYLCHCETQTAEIRNDQGNYLYICLSCNKAYEGREFFECSGCGGIYHDDFLGSYGCGEGGLAEMVTCQSCDSRERYEWEKYDAYRDK